MRRSYISFKLLAAHFHIILQNIHSTNHIRAGEGGGGLGGDNSIPQQIVIGQNCAN